MHRRDNGICLDCGLEQAFYKFSEEGRRLFYDLGLDLLSAENEFANYPPSPAWREEIHRRWYGRRVPKWDEYLARRGVRKIGRVLHLRCLYGGVLRHFAEQYGAEPWGMEMTHTCERYIREHETDIRLVEGRLCAAIEVDPQLSPKYDFIICFHTLSHSMDVRRDLTVLRSLLADGGMVIFCDEVMKKLENPFHLIHPDEQIFIRMLSTVFDGVDRISDCGEKIPIVTRYTTQGDNPDLVAWTGNGSCGTTT